MKINNKNWIYSLILLGFVLFLTNSCEKYDFGYTAQAVGTTDASEITKFSAACGGAILSDNGHALTSRGVCWSTTENPTTANFKLKDSGTTTGNFTSNLTGLNAGTTYYLKAYAINEVGTAYGNQISFTTLEPTFAILSTAAATAITITTATIQGTISDDGGATVTSRGVCWSTTASPTILNSNNQERSGIGIFTSSITGLTRSTKYYARSYATNKAGTAYGNEVVFITATLAIGDSYQGGKIAYLLTNGDPGYIVGQDHGLIAAPSDQSTAIQWYNAAYKITGASGTVLGTGNANTNAIVSIQGAGNYAAKLCSDLVLGGYSDWYLPSIDELYKLIINNNLIGGFQYSAFYWSSSELNNVNAVAQNMDVNFHSFPNKNALYYVRAVRSF